METTDDVDWLIGASPSKVGAGIIPAMKRTAVRSPLKAPIKDRAYWLSRPVEERFAEVERLRLQMLPPGTDEHTRIQKVVRRTTLREG
jgi:hypothetical protein